MNWWRRLCRLWAVLSTVRWTCAYCRRGNETPDLLWNELRVRLICNHCSRMQDYPNYIRALDPRPFGSAPDLRDLA